MVSSAMVYGAFSNNPVPITEESVLRPDPEFVFARQLASAEELVEEWRRGADGRSVTVLRPALADGRGRHIVARRALAPGSVTGSGRTTRRAVRPPRRRGVGRRALGRAAARRRVQRRSGRLDPRRAGPRASGDRLRFPLPERLREVVGALRWRFQRGPIPPGLRSVHPRAVGGRQRQAAIGRVGADGHQRAGLRRGHRVEVVDDGHAEAPPGALARRDGRRDRHGVDRGVQSCSAVAASPTSSSIGVKSALPPSSCWMHMPTDVAVVVDHRRPVGGIDVPDVSELHEHRRIGEHGHDVVGTRHVARDVEAVIGTSPASSATHAMPPSSPGSTTRARATWPVTSTTSIRRLSSRAIVDWGSRGSNGST